MPRRSLPILLALIALGCSQPAERAREFEVPVRVGTVALDNRNLPVVILEEQNGSRILPIWIGTAEAGSIAAQINRQPSVRPNFHDLAQRVIQGLDAKVVRVVVTELRGGTYYAQLTLRARGRDVEIDVRPSDGIAVALRTEAPILVRDSVFEDAGTDVEPDEPERAI